MIATVEPNEFQGIALAWISALTAILVAILAGLSVLVPKIISFYAAIREIKQKSEDNAARLDDHSRRITNANNKLTDVALVILPAAQANNKPK